MIDVNYHLLTEMGESAAGLRSRIANEYEELDPSRLFEGMTAAARDIPVWLKPVVAYLDSPFPGIRSAHGKKRREIPPLETPASCAGIHDKNRCGLLWP